jgi:hypothetical protein
MEHDDLPLSERDSLQLIHKMISTAKHDISENGFLYLLWGWLVLIASLCNYVLLAIVHYAHNYLPWAILMPIGGVISWIYGARMEKKAKVKTFVDEFMNISSIAFLVSLFITLFAMGPAGGPQAVYPFVLVLYGIWLFLSGGVLRFKPLMIGGVINWAAAVAAFYLTFEHQLLVLAGAVLLGYIIPGYMLKASYRNAAV